MKSRQFVLTSYPKEGCLPSKDNFKIREVELPPLKDGEVLFKTLYLSVYPFMRALLNPKIAGYRDAVKIGDVMVGTAIGEILESKSPKFKKGDFVIGDPGWSTFANLKDTEISKFDESLGPLSKALGALGRPGVTAYKGLLEIGAPKAGETVVVSAAAGSVGSLVGQIAKLQGCRVIGIAGGPTKCDYLTSKLHFDAAIDYRATKDLSAALKELCPKGIDVYFDNVGGPTLDAVLENCNEYARIPVCGFVSQYNDDPKKSYGLRNLSYVTFKQIKLQGFLVFRWAGTQEWVDAVKQMSKWIKEGKIIADEYIEEGFENIPRALSNLLTGANIGKAVVKIAEPKTTIDTTM